MPAVEIKRLADGRWAVIQGRAILATHATEADARAYLRKLRITVKP